jgi:hypothetical protein
LIGGTALLSVEAGLLAGLQFRHRKKMFHTKDEWFIDGRRP